jgi:cytidylate kinase
MQPTTKREHPVIAIDGPAGAGKSTLAAHLARRFGYLNLCARTEGDRKRLLL